MGCSSCRVRGRSDGGSTIFQDIPCVADKHNTCQSTPFLSQLLLTKSHLGVTLPYSAFPFILAPALFAGPLYTAYLDHELMCQSRGRGFGWLGTGNGKLSLMEVRNYIVVSRRNPFLRGVSDVS
jgi:hypothetical protein